MRSGLGRSSRACLAALLVGSCAATAGAATGPWRSNEHSAVRLISPDAVAPRSGTLHLGLHFTMIPGWHVYWKNSGDAGYPPEIDFAATPEIRSAELLWPAPHRYDLPGGLVAFGYGDEVVYPILATIEADGERISIRGEVDYLVCEIDCIPYRYELELELPLGGTEVEDGPTAALLDKWRAALPRAPKELQGTATRARWIAEGPGLAVDLDGQGLDPERLDLFFEVHDLFEIGTPEVAARPGGARFLVPLTQRDRNAELPASVEFAWTIVGLPPTLGATAVEAGQAVPRTPAADEPVGEATPQARAWLIPVLVALALGLAALAVALLHRRSTVAAAAAFSTLALLVALLYRIGLELDPARLAGVELGILAFSLFETLRRGGRRRAMLVVALTAAALLTLALVLGPALG